MYKHFAFVFLGFLSVIALSGCETVPTPSSSVISNGVQDERGGEIFKLAFSEEGAGNVYESTIDSKTHKLFFDKFYYDCQDGFCDNSQLEISEAAFTLIRNKLSGKNYNLLAGRLLQLQNDNTLILTEQSADFEFLTDTDYSTKDKDIIIQNPSSQVPIIIKFNKPHVFQDNYVNANDVVVLDSYGVASWFKEVEIASRQDTSPEGVYTTVHSFSPDSFVIAPYERIGSHNTFVFRGSERTPRPTINIDFPAELYTSKWEGNDLVVTFSELPLNKTYDFKLSWTDVGVNFVYTVNFSTIKKFAVSAEQQLYRDKTDGESHNNKYGICFSQPIDSEVVKQSLKNAVGSGAFGLYSYLEYSSMSVEDYENCFTIHFYLAPDKTYNFSLTGLVSAYGAKLNHDIELKPFALDKKDVYIKLIGDPVTFLPNPGPHADTIQVVAKNQSQGKIFYRACKFLADEPEKILDNFAQFKPNDTDYSNRFLAHQFVECGGTKSFPISMQEDKYRQEQVQNLPFDKFFDGNVPEIIEVGVQDFDRSRGFLYMPSNIGFVSKYSPKSLHVWTQYLDKGTALTGGTYSLGYYDPTQNTIVMRTGSLTGYKNFNFPIDIDLGFLYVKTQDSAGFVILPKWGFQAPYQLNSSQNYLYFDNLFNLDPYQVGGHPGRNENSPYQVYHYTDRVLYRAGAEDVFVSGWVRKAGENTKTEGLLSIELYNSQGDLLETQQYNSFDSFGGFKAKFALDKNSPLGSYRIASSFEDSEGRVSYFDSYIEIQEYKKSPISIETEMLFSDKTSLLRLMPKYYFGSYLESYDVTVSYTLAPEQSPVFDRDWCGEQRCENPYYYNNNAQYVQGSGGQLTIPNYKKSYLDLDLQVPNYGLSVFNIDVALVDHATEESVYKSISETLLPDYFVGILGWNWDRHNSIDKEPYVFEGNILEKVSADQHLLENYKKSKTNDSFTLYIYHKPFENKQTVGPDGEYYYTNAGEYILFDTQTVTVSDGEFAHAIDFGSGGEYLLRAVYKDHYENHQYLYVSDRSIPYQDIYGYMTNNHKLSVFVKDKDYEPGENIDINIDPYVKGAHAIVTVEKDGKILEHRDMILDGSTISIKADKSRYPNAHVSVVQILGSDLNKTISKREEPRLYIGYANMMLTPTQMEIDFDVKITDLSGKQLPYYYPGQAVKLNIQTRNFNGKRLPTRISVGIVDKALLDIYDILRTPLKSFYQASSPGFFIISNYQLLVKALQVFTADGEKGGGGGGESGILAPRKKFLDVAFWRGGEITDENGKLTLQTTLPDNLTTRAIDLIAVGHDGEMGTHRSYFTVSQDVILNVNLPRFVALHSSVEVPVSLIVQNTGLNDVKLSGTVSVGNSAQDITFRGDTVEKQYFDLSIDNFSLEELLDNEEVTVRVFADKYDAVEYKLPIRKDNSFVHQYSSFDGRKFTQSIALESPAKYAYMVAEVATAPVSQLSNSIEYLLYYPYGCTEQILSSLYPSVLAKKLSEEGLLSEGIISGESINYQGRRTPIDTLVSTSLEKIYANQHADGLFAYRPQSEYPDVSLSIYVFHVLTYLKSEGYKIDKQAYDKLSQSIKNIETIHDQLYLYLQRAIAGTKISPEKVGEIIKKNPSLENKILAYSIFSYNGHQNAEQRKDIQSQLKTHKRSYYYNYVNENTLKAYLIRALVRNGQFDEASSLVQEFLKTVSPEGTRGRSTQDNVQIINALSEYFLAVQNSNAPAAGKLTINGQTQAFSFVDEPALRYQQFVFTGGNWDKLDVTFESNQPVLVSVDTKYLPNDPKMLKPLLQQINTLDLGALSLEDIASTEVGGKVDVVGSFGVAQEVAQLAVVRYIPSNTYILNTIGEEGARYDCRECGGDRYEPSSDTKNKISFLSNGSSQERYSCVPDHYEIRYDRLFLYYDHLPADASCDVEFSLIKTHNGDTKVLSQQIFEMYSPAVWGRNFLVE